MDETSLFSIHANINSECENTLFETFEKLCDICMIDQAKYLYETKIKFLEEYNEDLLDIFYVLFLRPYIKHSTYNLECEMINWYVSIIKEKNCEDVDIKEIMTNIFISKNFHMFRIFAQCSFFTDLINEKRWLYNQIKACIRMNENANLVLEITNTIQFEPDYYLNFFVCAGNCNNTNFISIFEPKCHIKHKNKQVFTSVIDNMCRQQSYDTIVQFISKWNVIPTKKGFINACGNSCQLVDLICQNMIINEDCYKKGIHCATNHNKSEVIKYLLTHYDYKINLDFLLQLFKISCVTGHIDIINLFKNEIIIFCDEHTYNEAYNIACSNGHLNIVRFIDDAILNINETPFIFKIFADTIDEIFNKNYFYIVKYLLEIGYDFSATFNNTILFDVVCKKNYIDLAQLFVQFCPHKYSIEINENNIIISNVLQLLPISETIVNVKHELCSVCYELQSDIITSCNHQFCYQCLNKWFNKKQSCPYCREPFDSCNNIKEDT